MHMHTHTRTHAHTRTHTHTHTPSPNACDDRLHYQQAKSKLKDINLMCMDEFSRNRLVIGMMALLEDQTRRELSNGIQVCKLSSMTDTVSEPRYLYLKLGQDGRQYLSWSVPDDYVIEVFENQRHQPGAGGWGSSYPGHLLPSDRSRFTDEGGYNFKRSFTGNKSKVDLKDMVPRPGWSWEGAWTVDKQWTEVDEEGWHYARLVVGKYTATISCCFLLLLASPAPV